MAKPLPLPVWDRQRGKLVNESPRSRSILKAKPSVEELGERAIFDWLELVHVDVVLADKRLDFSRTPARVLVGGVEPVKERLRFDPLRDGTLGLGLVSRLMIVHPSSARMPLWHARFH